MYFLNNDQRRCFGLKPVLDDWKFQRINTSRYDMFDAFVYIKDKKVVKLICVSNDRYQELEYDELLSDDEKYLLPKTSKGKTVTLNYTNLSKRKQIGMTLSYCYKYIELYNSISDKNYFTTDYLQIKLDNINDFIDWVDTWCLETTEEDVEDIENFASEKRIHIKYNEGDVFRFKINRRKYGYGRILVDYTKMRKNKEKFWDILAGTALVCSVYHVITENKNLSIEDLKHLKSLPSSFMADNRIYYGEYEIIGNIPIGKNEDYPIMYGISIRAGENAVCFQEGKYHKKIIGGKVISEEFSFCHNAVSFSLDFKEDILKKCIKEKSNDPYWKLYFPKIVNDDLRNPKYTKQLKQIYKQMK